MSINIQSLVRRVAHPLLPSIRSCPFDLVARAELAIEGCTRLTNPERGGQPYSYAEFHTEPPIALHGPWDHFDSSGRLLEALTLARIMTATEADDRDESLARSLWTHQRSDGLLVLPSEPWTCSSPIVEMEWGPCAALLAWTSRSLAMDDVDSQLRASRLVEALHGRAVWEGDLCWFPASLMGVDGWRDRTPPTGRMTETLIGAQLIFALVHFGVGAGDTRALELARGLIRYLRERSGAFGDDGKMTDKTGRYLHGNLSLILGTLKYGIATARDADVEWAQHAYDSARSLGSEFGFFPRNIRDSEGVQGDTCATADMIEIAVLLGLHKDSRYFSDAERYGRNHLLESQFTDFDWVTDRIDAPFSRDLWCRNHPPEGVTTANVCERSLGAFAGWSLPNDTFDPANPRLMQRCTGSGVRALYALWHYAVTRTDAAVRVNMHFSHDSRWATVTSQQPTEGGVEILMKTRGVLAVRVPQGVEPADVEVAVKYERPRQADVRGGYAWVEALQQGDVVTINWPITERTLIYTINTRHYTGHWRGDTLLKLDPPGKLAPTYRRFGLMPSAPAHGATGPMREIDTL